MCDPKVIWHKVGTLNGSKVYKSTEGDLAIERDFEVLCQLTEEEQKQWHAHRACSGAQGCCSTR